MRLASEYGTAAKRKAYELELNFVRAEVLLEAKGNPTGDGRIAKTQAY